jgi:hypothetical protein
MRKLFIVIILHSLLLFGCQNNTKDSDNQKYLRWVGDIEQNDQIDELDFTICNGNDNIIQYFNIGEGPVYKGEKSEILKTFKSKFESISGEDQSGLIRIRFVVNCEGKAGRFRVLQSDYEYQEKDFNEKIVSQLLNITKQINNWEILYKAGKPVDYYMYLIFKITDGQLTEILP